MLLVTKNEGALGVARGTVTGEHPAAVLPTTRRKEERTNPIKKGHKI
jgi:hypothetical protein